VFLTCLFVWLVAWLVLICSKKKVLLAGCWWLVCSERKSTVGWWLISRTNKLLMLIVYLKIGSVSCANPTPCATFANSYMGH
jgi:hypothetical protein